MKYQVSFRERTDAAGNATENPPAFVEPELMDGIVLNATLVERIEPDSMHGQDVMDEDDDFLSIGTEVWEYDIAEGRDQAATLTSGEGRNVSEGMLVSRR